MFRNINIKICNLNVFMVLFCIIWKWRTNFFVYLLTRDIGAAEHGAREAVAGWPARCRIPETVSQDGGGGVTTALWCQWCNQWYIFYETAIWVSEETWPGEIADQCSQKVSNLLWSEEEGLMRGSRNYRGGFLNNPPFGWLSISGLKWSSFKNVN